MKFLACTVQTLWLLLVWAYAMVWGPLRVMAATTLIFGTQILRIWIRA